MCHDRENSHVSFTQQTLSLQTTLHKGLFHDMKFDPSLPVDVEVYAYTRWNRPVISPEMICIFNRFLLDVRKKLWYPHEDISHVTLQQITLWFVFENNKISRAKKKIEISIYQVWNHNSPKICCKHNYWFISPKNHIQMRKLKKSAFVFSVKWIFNTLNSITITRAKFTSSQFGSKQ